MMDSDNYYNMCLKDKNIEEINIEIEELKILLNDLEERASYSIYEDDISHSLYTRLQLTEEYLEKAKETLLDLDGVYKPSKAELKILKFEENL